MLGRRYLMREIDKHLQKPEPDHVSVVGPAHFGKSVLLRHVATSYRAKPSGYLTTVHIDLRHGIPTSDKDFIRRLADEIKTQLQEFYPQIAELIDLEDEAIHEILGLVFEELERKGQRLLVVLDGFDYALAGSDLTRNLWDQLRTLAQSVSLRLVAGSRLPLRELCKNEDSKTSDFWEIFYDTPLRVASLDDDDMAAFLLPLFNEGCEFDTSARKEITNWTGGAPLLVCALLQTLWEDHRGSRLSKLEIDQAAKSQLIERRHLLGALWDDCDDKIKADLSILCDRDIPLTDLPEWRRRSVEERGFGRVSGNRLRSSCRLMERYAQAQAPAIADLTRLLGTTVGFETHIRSLLELRLAQVPIGADDELYACVRNAIHALAPVPGGALVWVRSIANRALRLVWDAELPPDRTVPSRWRNEARNAGVNYPDQDKLPREYGAQLSILRFATGTRRTSRQVRYITKTTFLLLDYLLSVGDFGQHRDSFPETEVTIGFATAVVLAAISLVECLTDDLQRPAGSA